MKGREQLRGGGDEACIRSLLINGKFERDLGDERSIFSVAEYCVASIASLPRAGCVHARWSPIVTQRSSHCGTITLMSLWAMILQVLILAKRIELQQEAIRAEQIAQRATLDKILKAVTPGPATGLVLTLGVPTPK